MIQNVIRSVGGIEVIGVLSILLFFACFLGVLVWTFGLKKSYLDSVSKLPLEPDAAPRAGSGPGAQPDAPHE